MFRKAALKDIEALVKIENASFDSDRISRKNFHYLLTRANAETIVKEKDGEICGYAMLLFHEGTSLARFYSIAIDPAFRGYGFGESFFKEVEKTAIEHDCVYIRLEVKIDNSASIKLIKKWGYKQIGVIPEYYEDNKDALRFEKFLGESLQPAIARVPYYEQTLEFTCGSAALMMAMKALDKDLPLDRSTELSIWRESTTIFMTSGHGGCGPYGLSLAAHKRGFDVELYVKDDPALFFLDSVRSKEKKEVIKLVQEDFKKQISSLPVKVIRRSMEQYELENKFTDGGIPVILISSYRINREKSPHWVVITGFDEKYIYCHDPYVNYENGKSQTDCINIPILKKEFDKMARYGKSIQRATLIIKRPG